MNLLIYCGLAAIMFAGLAAWALWLDKRSKQRKS